MALGSLSTHTMPTILYSSKGNLLIGGVVAVITASFSFGVLINGLKGSLLPVELHTETGFSKSVF